MRTGESRWGTPTEGDVWLRGTAHTPTVVVVADELHGEPRAAFPQLSQRWPGVWCGRDPVQGGLVVLDIARLPEQLPREFIIAADIPCLCCIILGLLF